MLWSLKVYEQINRLANVSPSWLHMLDVMTPCYVASYQDFCENMLLFKSRSKIEPNASKVGNISETFNIQSFNMYIYI